MIDFRAISVVIALTCTGASAQYCEPECYQTCLSFYDFIRDLNPTNAFFAAYGKYADYLRYIKAIREATNSKGTAYAMDMSGFAIHWAMQKNIAYATSIINPADTSCNPFFLTRYSQQYYLGYCASSQGNWHCRDRCDAANVLDNLGFNVPEGPNQPDRLRCGCHHSHILAQNPFAGPSCWPEDISSNEMLLAFTNSNDQATGSACENFTPRIATNVNGASTVGGGFINRGFSTLHYFWPASWMKTCLKYFCCASKKRMDDSGMDSMFAVSINGTDGLTDEITAATDEDGLKREHPGSVNVPNRITGTERRFTNRVMRKESNHETMLMRGLTAAKEAGMDFGDWDLGLVSEPTQ